MDFIKEQIDSLYMDLFFIGLSTITPKDYIKQEIINKLKEKINFNFESEGEKSFYWLKNSNDKNYMKIEYDNIITQYIK